MRKSPWLFTVLSAAPLPAAAQAARMKIVLDTQIGITVSDSAK